MKDKIYLRNTDLEDREKRNRIFNSETGISEDGTMHDGVYRPWINQPKKEQTMNREDIKNCPFCGSRYANKPEVMNYYNSYTGTQYFIRCTYCFATSRHTNSEKEAIDAWNRRVKND